MPLRQLRHQTPQPRPFARHERITGQGTAGLIRSTLLLSIMTVDKTLVRNYDEYLARPWPRNRASGSLSVDRVRWAIGAGRIDHATSVAPGGYIEMESFIGTI
jgi:hypothetical protein